MVENRKQRNISTTKALRLIPIKEVRQKDDETERIDRLRVGSK